MSPRLLGLLLLAVMAGFAQTKPAAAVKKTAFDKPTLEAYLRHQFLIPPNLKVVIDDPKPSEMPEFQNVLVKVGDGTNPPQEVLFYVSKDGQKILQGQIFDIKENPFQKDLALLKTDFQPSMGTPGAPVVLVLFSDFQCAYCKEEAKVLRQNLLAAYPKDVRLYFKDFPLEQIHPWAKAAAVAGRCVFKQNPAAFWDYHDWVYEQQASLAGESLKAKVMEFGAQKNLDALQLTRCIDTKATEKDVEKSQAEGRALQINSTPTLFVNGRRLMGKVEWAQLKQVIDHEIEYQKTAKNAGEQACCELKLAIPGFKQQ